MRIEWRGTGPWLIGWLIVALAGSLVIVRLDIAGRREAFRAEARVAHRLLSQRAAQHEAVLETLALLQPGSGAASATGDALDGPQRRLPALYPQIVSVLRHEAGADWPSMTLAGRLTLADRQRPGAGADLKSAEDLSRHAHRVALGPVDAAARHFALVLASVPASYAIVVDVQRMVPWGEWPVERLGPVRVGLTVADATIELQAGHPPALQPVGLTEGFVFSEPLSSTSQPFVLTLQKATGPVQWPWTWLSAWLLSTALIAWAWAARQRSRLRQRRAEELLRVGQVARLNAMGELAGGMAHELNQPLAAMLANTQAARRLLADDPPELETALAALEKASAQARRAADVVGRLRRLVEAPMGMRSRDAVSVAQVGRKALALLAPELRARGITTSVDGPDSAVAADPVALEQIIHNLVNNAMQALDDVPASERRLELEVEELSRTVQLVVRDSGPGIAPELVNRLFQPFQSTRAGGLGLGLSLSLSLAESMDGTLTARPAPSRGTEFVLELQRHESSS